MADRDQPNPASSLDIMPLPRRIFRSAWPALLLTTLVIGLLMLVSWGFLIPAIAAAATATETERAALVAFSRLMLAILLVILVVGMLLALRARRLLRNSRSPARQTTVYTDVWSESGRRMKPPAE